jgi:hypothetical protein
MYRAAEEVGVERKARAAVAIANRRNMIRQELISRQIDNRTESEKTHM